jgi:hypothetical protein
MRSAQAKRAPKIKGTATSCHLLQTTANLLILRATNPDNQEGLGGGLENLLLDRSRTNVTDKGTRTGVAFEKVNESVTKSASLRSADSLGVSSSS